MFPTPTPLPVPPVAPITFDAGNYRIWQFADEAIQVWNYEPNLGPVIQIAIIVAIVIIFVVLLTHLIQNTMDEE